MQVVVSVLDARYYRKVEGLWDRLETCCDLSGIRLTPVPHFSWQLAESYDVEAVVGALEQLSKDLSPFDIQTSGLGIFSGDSPVLYLPVVKDQRLLELHKTISKRLTGLGRTVSKHYAPEHWIPHITLAHGDTSAEQVSRAVGMLAEAPFCWKIAIDNLALVEQEGNETGKLIGQVKLKA
jgi:2'-5' RNA ligase